MTKQYMVSDDYIDNKADSKSDDNDNNYINYHKH